MYYVGTINDIMKVNFRAFHFFIFDTKCFKIVCRGAQEIVRRDGSDFFPNVSTKLWSDQSDTFVLPQHFEHVIISLVQYN